MLINDGCKLAIAAGIDDPDSPIGTDPIKVMEAIESVADTDHVLVMMDIGSALLSAETALDLLDPAIAAKVRLCAAPLVEGTLAATVSAASGAGIDKVIADAMNALEAKRIQLGLPSPTPDAAPTPTLADDGDSKSLAVVIQNHNGLHVRPASKLVAALAGFNADLLLEKNGKCVKPDSLNQIALLQVRRNDKLRLLSTFSKRIPHDTVNASDDLSFTVNRGESLALLGDNGAGKSTALKMITGVCFPTSGTVEVHGRVSALLELSAGFDMKLSGMENIDMRCQLWGLSKEESKELIPEIVEFSELGKYIDQPMRTYSSGMRARLGFAFVSSIRPDILVVDEALSVGDRKFAKKCRERVNSIIANENVTVLFVTHSTGTAKEFCHRGIVIQKGKAMFSGGIEEAVDFYTAS